ncbi:hypothetical protein [Streptomyces cellulosae]|jgi:hypothetical protein|uniref:hypothetical protein n=1 Tax=Streptomyces sp. P9-2 TaxID=3423201 RepID=UPI001677C912|nr:hypothetical protein GCM10018771_64850 [Streptomyces cellulosae]
MNPALRRFPLVARFRPACLPLPQRVQALTDLAETARASSDQGTASAVFNQAALIASDVGLPRLAAAWCHQHAHGYLHACPLPGMTAIRALEPVVNLARLQIRAGLPDSGRQRLLALYKVVDTGTDGHFDDITVPAHLTSSPEDRREVRAWLWRVLLADGTRTLTASGRWAEALAHIETHRGIGRHMLDGRQVAVLASIASGETERVQQLLAETEPGDPWEQLVTACLAELARRGLGQTIPPPMTDLATAYLEHPDGHGLTVFDIRMGLTALDIIGTRSAAARRIVHDLHRRTAEAWDGYAAREILAHPVFTALASDQQLQDCHSLVAECGLEAGRLPNDLRRQLISALVVSDGVIRDSLQRAAT